MFQASSDCVFACGCVYELVSVCVCVFLSCVYVVGVKGCSRFRELLLGLHRALVGLESVLQLALILQGTVV